MQSKVSEQCFIMQKIADQPPDFLFLHLPVQEAVDIFQLF